MKHILWLCMGLLVPAAWLLAQQGVSHEALKKLVAEREAFQRSTGTDSLKPLGDFSEQRFAADYAFALQYQKKLLALDTAGFSFSDQITWELLVFVTDDAVKQYSMQRYLNPILVDDGFQMNLPRRIPAAFRNSRDAEQYLRLLQDIPRYCQEHFALMRRGLKAGICQPQVVIRAFESTYKSQLVALPEQSPFFAPFRQRPATIDEAQWATLVQQGRRAVSDIVLPQYKAIQQFYEQEYIPQTKRSLGVMDYPNGKQYYQQLVNYFTTTNLSYDEVYVLGEKEVARIEAEMLAVLKEVNFTGTLQEFIAMLRTDPRFYATTPEQLLKEAAYIAKKIDGKLPLFFGKLPRLPYTVAPVPADLAPNYTGGRYSPGRGTRAGEYWVNTYNLPARSLYNLEALSLHEAVPGHHLQFALSQELTDLPEFRRYLYVNAFGEGWALYGEYLGTEMGFYTDPYSRFGKLTYEMWRACRLVVDVGLHVKGWTREQAVNYLASHTALSLHEVNTETDRYISWPGQALSYKVGELKIRELRAKTEQALGAKFDIRSFHDMILSQGTVTLSILERMTDRYIQQQLKKP